MPLWKARAPLQWSIFLNHEVGTHKAPFRFAPILVSVLVCEILGSGSHQQNWCATALSAMIVLVRNNKARPCTAQGTRRLSRPTRTRMHTETNSHSQHQHALQHQHAPTRSPTQTHAKTHANAQPSTTKRTLNRRSRCWDHGNSHDPASPVYQDWNEVSRLANDRITSSKLETFLLNRNWARDTRFGVNMHAPSLSIRHTCLRIVLFFFA